MKVSVKVNGNYDQPLPLRAALVLRFYHTLGILSSQDGSHIPLIVFFQLENKQIQTLIKYERDSNWN
jgi:hypothetical protein